MLASVKFSWLLDYLLILDFLALLIQFLRLEPLIQFAFSLPVLLLSLQQLEHLLLQSHHRDPVLLIEQLELGVHSRPPHSSDHYPRRGRRESLFLRESIPRRVLLELIQFWLPKATIALAFDLDFKLLLSIEGPPGVLHGDWTVRAVVSPGDLLSLWHFRLRSYCVFVIDATDERVDLQQYPLVDFIDRAYDADVLHYFLGVLFLEDLADAFHGLELVFYAEVAFSVLPALAG